MSFLNRILIGRNVKLISPKLGLYRMGKIYTIVDTIVIKDEIYQVM